MVFSSQLFLYGFMPIFFSLYYLIADQRKNWLILIASLVFYGIGAGGTVLVLLISILVNQFLALRIEPAPPARRRCSCPRITVSRYPAETTPRASFFQSRRANANALR